MAKPVLLGDNWYDATVLHPTHIVEATDSTGAAVTDPVDQEVFRIADNLRDLSGWSSVTANVERNLRVALSAARTDDTLIALDRGHNLAGKTIHWERADNAAFSVSYATIFSATIPSTPGGLASDANGCLTPSGVWWKTFSHVGSTSYRRLRIPALGAGIAPIVTGFYAGTAYRFPEYLDAPAAYDYRRKYSFKRNELSEGGVRGKSRPRRFDELDIHFELEASDYAAFETEVTRLLDYGHPWWFCVDDGSAAGSALMRFFDVPGDLTYDPVVDPVHRRIAILLEEVAPRLVI